LLRHSLMPPTHSFFPTSASPTEIYTLSLHDALPIYKPAQKTNKITNSRFISASQSVKIFFFVSYKTVKKNLLLQKNALKRVCERSEEHTSELQSRENLVCRLLLEKKKKNKRTNCARQ